MPSSKKTPNLLLNKWLGSDKPKKDDFNEDNDILDHEVGELRVKVVQTGAVAAELVAMAKTELEGKITAAGTTWDGKLSQKETTWNQNLEAAKATLGGQTSTVQTNLNTHTGTAAIHVSQSQKDSWSNQAPVTGTYTGDGNTRRVISLGFTPKAGFVFAVGLPPVKSIWSSQTGDVYAASFADTVFSGGIASESGGFAVLSTARGSDGYSFNLNDSGKVYGYVVWR